MCEGLSICGRSERDSIGMRRERLFATLRVANAEIQPGNYFGLFDRVDNLARLVGFFIVKLDLRKGHEDRPGTGFLSRPRFA